jgi:DNA topoisomerase I
MAKNLVIVESPAKAKTIEKYLGKDYTVLSSFGHIRDLPKKGISIDIANNFTPTYEISTDKRRVVTELKKLAKEASQVWLASDEDREGEAIAWHLSEALKLDINKTKRIVFHEITKPAILNAIEHPRSVDINLVNAQQARRVLDRLVGYELSPVIWKKVKAGLSAGRVQSVAVRLIVEREREIKAFESESSYRITASFITPNGELPAEMSNKLDDESKSMDLLKDCITATFKVANIQKKPGTRNPGAPFTTSTLQQEASRKLGYSVKQTMTLAQRLYENGHITYMRTDSTNLSGFAIDAAKTYIIDNFGPSYSKVRQYKTKSQGAQEAHEAIRPTSFQTQEAGSDAQQKKLYKLIWQRALSSQMSPAKTDKTEVIIEISNRSETLIAKGETLVFDGFLKVYGGGKDDTILPVVSLDQTLVLDIMSATQSFSRPSARYSEASLVKALEEMGIGRPSTYAPTISTIQARGYVEKSDLEGSERNIHKLTLQNKKISTSDEKVTTGADKNKLIPTHLADMVTDFLVNHFSSIVDYEFTANAEAQFDEIADGKLQWQNMIGNFYENFHPLVVKSADVSRAETSQARVLGEDPKSGKPIIARYGRYGAMLQLGETEDETTKPIFAPMPTGTNIESVTLELALEMFKLPRLVGETSDGKEIKANIGRFGPYIQVDKLFVSIKPFDPMTITLDQAIELYLQKIEKEANKYIASFKSGIQIVNGPYGPYVTDGKKNARIAKDVDPKTFTEDDCKTLLEKAPVKGKGRKFTKRTKK